jgi:hypothetical protein
MVRPDWSLELQRTKYIVNRASERMEVVIPYCPANLES